MKAWILILVLLIAVTLAHGQTSKTPIKNGILQSDLDAAGYKINRANMVDYAGLNMTWNPVTGRFDAAAGGGGGGAVSSVFTRTGAVVALVGDYSAFYQPLDTDLTTWAGLTPSANFQTMVPHTFAQMKTDLGLVIGTNVQAWDTDLDGWALKAPYAGTLTITTGKTLNATNSLTFSGTDGSTLNIGAGGTLGTAAYTASGAYEVPLTFSTGLTRTTNTITVNTSQNIATLSNLTTNGFVKTGGAVGTLSVDTATYQAADADLTTWAGITPVAAVGTWIATPSSANLRLAMTDENGTGALLFSGATTPDFTTGFTIGAAAASGKILVGNGTNFVPSTPTYPNAASPTARKFIVSDGTNWTASTETQAVPGTSGNVSTSDGTNWTSAAPVVTASNTVTFTNKRITKRSLALGAPTPAPSINADNFDVVHITGLTGAITSITMTGTPVEGDTLRMDFTDNGTARAIALGTSFEAGAAPLPTTTVISTRLDTVFYWNTVTSKWRCQASSASPTYPAAAGAVGYTIRSDATNFASYPAQLVNSSVASQSPSTSDVYLTGSNIVVTAGDMKAKGQYKCVFDMTKSAGTGAIVITLRVGTGTGAVGDAAIQTYTFGAGTSVADFGLFEIIATWRTVGSGTSAVIQGMCRGTHQLATTGLFNNAAGWMVLGSPSPSSGFNSNTATVIGLSFNGSTAFAGTTQIVQAQLQQ